MRLNLYHRVCLLVDSLCLGLKHTASTAEQRFTFATSPLKSLLPSSLGDHSSQVPLCTIGHDTLVVECRIYDRQNPSLNYSLSVSIKSQTNPGNIIEIVLSQCRLLQLQQWIFIMIMERGSSVVERRTRNRESGFESPLATDSKIGHFLSLH